MLDRPDFLLVHDLGLGKSVTTIAACEEKIDTGEAKQILIICNASIKWQWRRRLREFTDGALVCVVEGTKPQRAMQYRRIKQGRYEYVIVNYEQIVNDWQIFRYLRWDVIVCDEIVAIKTPSTARTRHIRRLDAPVKYGLTGQPIENRPEELYHIMEWINPSVLGPPNIFEQTFVKRDDYGNLKGARNLSLLRKLMDPVMDRKRWSDPDIKVQMPAIVEEELLSDMDPASRRVYRYIALDLLEAIDQSPHFNNFNVWDHYAGTAESAAQGEIMSRLMALRMLCDHPALLSYSAKLFNDPTMRAGSRYAAELRERGVLDPVFKKKRSQKLIDVLDLIKEILEADRDNKVVVFSFFKPMLHIIGMHLKVGWERFDGDMTPRERDDAVVRFGKNLNCRVLLSSDAGGVGLDLPMANHLINYDLPWSAGKWKQRCGRIVRLSSTFPEVRLISAMVRDSIEERMMDMLVTKQAVASAWLDGHGVDETGSFEVSLDTLRAFLRERTA
jgi:SNF2 family DNA or RNA helicase